MKYGKIFWGVFFVLAAAFIIVGYMGYLQGMSIWTVLLSVVLASIMLKGLIEIEFFSILMPPAVMMIIFAKQWHLEAITPWPVIIAALLLTIGLYILFGKRVALRKARRWQARNPRNVNRVHSHKANCQQNEKFTEHHHEHFETLEDLSGDSINSSVNFGSGIKYIYSNNLERANFGCSFGALKVYFNQATPSPQGCVIHLDSKFSGVEFYIPRGWRIENHISTSLGAVEIQGVQSDSDSPPVRFTGDVSLGALNIIYV